MHFLFKNNLITFFLKAKKAKYILIGILLFLPGFVFAALVPCGGPGDPCGFSDLIVMINGIINFLLFSVAIPVAAIMFAAAGFMLITAGGDTGKISQAKEIFGSVLWGILIAFMAWIIIQTLLVAAGLDSDYSYLT